MHQSFVYVFKAGQSRPASNIYKNRTLEIFSCLYNLGPLLFPFQYRFLQSPSTCNHMAWHDIAFFRFSSPEIIAVNWLFLARSLRKAKGVEEEA